LSLCPVYNIKSICNLIADVLCRKLISDNQAVAQDAEYKVLACLPLLSGLTCNLDQDKIRTHQKGVKKQIAKEALTDLDAFKKFQPPFDALVTETSRMV